MSDKYMLTPPDLDHSSRIKLMVVGLDRSQVDALISKIQLLPHTLTLYVYDEYIKDQTWCLIAAKQCDSMLIDVAPSSMDQLKGYLLSMPNSSALGTCEFARKIYHDPVLWLTDAMMKYQTVPEEEQQ